ncbi:hypothetical protein [Moorena sp. SIO3B2]|uniref:hypothetical protein n=1 Tax=Moorena sp. SIO3B2 TaxID=2607827 RepID=UPI0013C6CA95|nr:hypothetical protein [Moorena sp. SIO3B2]NEP35261.1 hypothetical protein [Moorena sp. SIO3B2]
MTNPKFCFRTAFRLVLTHDFSTVDTDQVLIEFKPVGGIAPTGKSVETGNNLCELIAAHKSFQYGFKTKYFGVESRPDVKDDFCFEEVGVHVGDLSGEFVFLLVATEEAVTDGT